MEENVFLYGKEAVELRRTQIISLVNVVKGTRGWRDSFYEQFPHFKTIEGDKVLTNATRGICDDPEMLRCLEIFIPFVQETKPDWYKPL